MLGDLLSSFCKRRLGLCQLGASLVDILGALGRADGRVLIVAPGTDETLILSARNLPGVEVIRADSLNVVALLNADTVLIEQPALTKMEEVYG